MYKKIKEQIVIGIMSLVSITALAQNEQKSESPVSKGSWLIESNTGFGNLSPSNTGFGLKIQNKSILYNIGAEGGYFIMDRLAIKVGFGFGNLATGSANFNSGSDGGENSGAGEANEGGSGSGEAGEGNGSGSGQGQAGYGPAEIQGIGPIFSYKIGAKYYIIDRIPIQLDFSGTNIQDYHFEAGLQAGYSLFLGENKNIAIEPGFRYAMPLADNTYPKTSTFQLNLGFSFILK